MVVNPQSQKKWTQAAATEAKRHRYRQQPVGHEKSGGSAAIYKNPPSCGDVGGSCKRQHQKPAAESQNSTQIVVSNKGKTPAKFFPHDCAELQCGMPQRFQLP